MVWNIISFIFRQDNVFIENFVEIHQMISSPTYKYIRIMSQDYQRAYALEIILLNQKKTVTAYMEEVAVVIIIIILRIIMLVELDW